jgi:hypothetical protein
VSNRKTLPLSAEAFRQIEINVAITRLQQELDQLNDPVITDQLRYAIEQVRKDGDFENLIELTKYRRTPVPLDEFLYGSMYLGLRPSELFPGVTEALHELDTGNYVEAVIKGGIGSGKSTIANLGILRQLYFISCLRHPQATFGVQRNSSIVFTIQSVRLTTAKKAVFQEMGAYIANSPYFTKVYPYDKRITSEMVFREQRVTIMPVSSSDTGAISLNVIGGLLDEMNFMQKVAKSKNDHADVSGEYDQAKNLYLNLSKRRRSRFMSRGKLPGILFLVSSSRYPDDFTEVKAAEAASQGGPDPQIYVFSKSLWESRGRDKYNPKSFRVLVGNERHKSRILNENEAAPPDMEVIEVPEDFRSEFIKDVDGSIRDLAGRTTLATRPFLRNREAIYNCMALAEQYGYRLLHNMEEVDLHITKPGVIEANLRTDVKQMRVVHVDLAVSRDAAGLAIGHVAGTKTCTRINFETGQTVTEVLPVIAFDAVLRIVPPTNGEIDFSMIRQIIYDLKEKYGLPIKVVTTDGFNSVDFRQILAKKGYATDYLSVDRNPQPYIAFRDAINDGRIFMPRHNYLMKELVELEYVRAGSKEKIDHRPHGGSKDVADAVCGVASYLMTRRAAWTQQPIFIGQGGYMLHGRRTVHENVQLMERPKEQIEQGLYRRTVRKKIVRRPASRHKSS